MKHRFKINDKVILLPSARKVGISRCSIGLEGTITDVGQDSYLVYVPCSKCKSAHTWSIHDYQMRKVLHTKQLYLWKIV